MGKGAEPWGLESQGGPLALTPLSPLPPRHPGPGPYGERDDQQVFIQKVVPAASQLFVRLSSTGQR